LCDDLGQRDAFPDRSGVPGDLQGPHVVTEEDERDVDDKLIDEPGGEALLPVSAPIIPTVLPSEAIRAVATAPSTLSKPLHPTCTRSAAETVIGRDRCRGAHLVLTDDRRGLGKPLPERARFCPVTVRWSSAPR
jgi:hypothetical protein